MKNKAGKWVLFKAAAVIILIVIIYCATTNFGASNAHQTGEGDHSSIKVAAVGDSITYGLMVNNWSDNAYPHQLAELLGEAYWVENFGANNYAAMKSADFPYADTEEYRNSLEFNPDIVIIMLGTNDSKINNWQGHEQFREEYSELVDVYIDNEPGTEIYLATPPKAFNEADLPGDINNDNIDEITQIVKEVAAEKEAELIDINQLTQEKRQWFQLDGIHPNAEGSERIAEEVYQHIAE
ncbi:GDSL-type esterase/lipase family protein [Salinicoccus sp. HZC-1]|uniref:GDSL-type esterase/lipase family protein n=1 Tax=Salinicoccus sp. HZC-1 TaxID=3385497 RepID=UPI00398ADE3E